MTVKLLVRASRDLILRARAWVTVPSSGVVDWRIVRNAQTSWMAAGASTCAP